MKGLWKDLTLSWAPQIKIILKKNQKNRTKNHQDVICPFYCADIWTNGAKAMVVWKGFIIFLAPIKVAGTELP